MNSLLTKSIIILISLATSSNAAAQGANHPIVDSSGAVCWSFQSDQGWKAYPPSDIQQIETAYKANHPQVILKPDNIYKVVFDRRTIPSKFYQVRVDGTQIRPRAVGRTSCEALKAARPPPTRPIAGGKPAADKISKEEQAKIDAAIKASIQDAKDQEKFDTAAILQQSKLQAEAEQQFQQDCMQQQQQQYPQAQVAAQYPPQMEMGGYPHWVEPGQCQPPAQPAMGAGQQCQSDGGKPVGMKDGMKMLAATAAGGIAHHIFSSGQQNANPYGQAQDPMAGGAPAGYPQQHQHHHHHHHHDPQQYQQMHAPPYSGYGYGGQPGMQMAPQQMQYGYGGQEDAAL